MSGERFVLDRDGDLWQSNGDGTWRCLTTASCEVHGGDLVNVCGPLRELLPVSLDPTKNGKPATNPEEKP